ncbi:CSRN2 protein, partial [Rostratula benghalensis]|nr:CSRN2 protein [Rostratula benghalensis]
MKLELENKRQGLGRPPAPEEDALSPAPAAAAAAGAWLGSQAAETQDFQEFMAENETAVLHLQTAEELERLKAEEDSSNGSGVESLGVCILEEPLAAPQGLCPGLAAPILIQAQLPPGSSLLCFAEGSEQAASGNQPYSNDGPVLYYQVEQRPVLGSKGDGGPAEPPPVPSSCPGDKDLGVLPGPVVTCSRAPAAPSKGETSPNPPS